MPPKDKYTDPELRDEVKREVHDSDKGGAPGQWSARKAQFMASEYKKRGGGYNTDKSQQDESQKNLSKWSEEEWQTKEGSGNAKQQDGTEKRYLPKKAWENMTEDEKKETDEKKLEGSKEGKQHVANTGKAKESRSKANNEEHEKFETRKAEEQQKDGDGEDVEAGNGEDDVATDEDSEAGYQNDEDEDEDDADDDDKDAEAEQGEEEQADKVNDEDHEEDSPEGNEKQASAGRKRKGGKQQTNGASKKQKSNDSGNAPPGKVGSKHMDADEPAPRGSADRLPKKGAQVTWKAMPGYVDGAVEEVLTSGKKVDGKSVKASKSDPKLVLKSTSSGKICVHKPDACFYE